VSAISRPTSRVPPVTRARLFFSCNSIDAPFEVTGRLALPIHFRSRREQFGALKLMRGIGMLTGNPRIVKYLHNKELI
jgi:hypothetical protein